MLERWLNYINEAKAWQRPLLLLAMVVVVVALALGIVECINNFRIAGIGVMMLGVYWLLYKLME